MESPSFPEKFFHLVSGLDEQSRDTVIRILARISQAIETKKFFLDIYTQEEQEKLRLVQENFYSQILQLSDDLFAWRDYLLPMGLLYPNSLYDRHGLSTLKNPDAARGKAIIDAGAFIGDSALIFAQLAPSAIYAFEPVPKYFELLKRTLELNHITNAVPENIALGAENGTATMRIDSYKGGSSIVKADSSAKQSGHITVPLRALDDYVAECSLQVGLIKTDLEGAEPDFIAGAKRTICGQKPILLISIYHNPHDFFEIKPLIESWELGYRFSVYRPAIPGIHSETLLIGESS